MDWAKATARGDKKHLSFGIWCDLYEKFYDSVCAYDYQLFCNNSNETNMAVNSR